MSTQADTLDKFVNGDRRTIAELYDNVFPSIKRLILNNSGRMEDAEDIFQEALVVLYRKVKEESLSLSCSLITYIYSISRNLWMDRLRRLQRFTPMVAEDSEFVELSEDTIEVMHHNERSTLFYKYFEYLKGDCKQVLKLFFDGVSMKEIGERMGYLSEDYARKKKYTCKKNLMKQIKSDPKFSELSEGHIDALNTIK